jgi:gluconokinase
MSEIIYPRSPRETMCGWMHLPRFIDKLRLHNAGKLHADYQGNLTKGFDGLWLKTAGVDAEVFKEVVKRSITDGEVCDWVRTHVNKPESVKAEHRAHMLSYPKPDDAEMQARLKQRKADAGLAHRDDIKTFVDFIDADEKRL